MSMLTDTLQQLKSRLLAACLARFNPKCENPHSKGFTLVEIIITIVIVGIIAGIAAMIIAEGVRAYSDAQVRSDVHYQARLAMERMAREIRMIRSCGDINPPGSNPSGTISFTDINGNGVNFSSAAGNNLNRGANLLARGITSGQPFTFLAADGTTLTTACPGIWLVQIDLTSTQGSETLQIRTRVHPRNF